MTIAVVWVKSDWPEGNTEKYQEFLLILFKAVHANSRISLLEQKIVRSRIHTFIIHEDYYNLV